jgi:cell division protein FtsL
VVIVFQGKIMEQGDLNLFKKISNIENALYEITLVGALMLLVSIVALIHFW